VAATRLTPWEQEIGAAGRDLACETVAYVHFHTEKFLLKVAFERKLSGDVVETRLT